MCVFACRLNETGEGYRNIHSSQTVSSVSWETLPWEASVARSPFLQRNNFQLWSACPVLKKRKDKSNSYTEDTWIVTGRKAGIISQIHSTRRSHSCKVSNFLNYTITTLFVKLQGCRTNSVHFKFMYKQVSKWHWGACAIMNPVFPSFHAWASSLALQRKSREHFWYV